MGQTSRQKERQMKRKPRGSLVWTQKHLENCPSPNELNVYLFGGMVLCIHL